ncbi:MAG: hypothetical protein RJQ14_26520, partial [Marinoscillum sp.]
MKNIFLFTSAFLVGWSVYAQDTLRLSGEYSSTSIKTLLLEIESESDFQFFFQDSWLDSLTISATFQNASLKEVLKTALENTSLSYFIDKHKVILTDNAVIIDQPKLLN